ncbi:hypothetical protein L9F63_016029, partial [Diploptera punctata]
RRFPTYFYSTVSLINILGKSVSLYNRIRLFSLLNRTTTHNVKLEDCIAINVLSLDISDGVS